jgi:hypothetical protein
MIQQDLENIASYIHHLEIAVVTLLLNSCGAAEILDDGTHRIDCTKEEWGSHIKACEYARSVLGYDPEERGNHV